MNLNVFPMLVMAFSEQHSLILKFSDAGCFPVNEVKLVQSRDTKIVVQP